MFNNFEASVLFDFTSQDKSGLKLLNQLKDYFAPLLEYDDPNLNLVTQEYIEELDQKGLLSNENLDNDYGTDNFKKNYDNLKKSNKNRDTGELGNIEISEKENQTERNRQRLIISEDYINKWPLMFERLKIYKDKFKSTVVSRNHHDRTLFGWYRKQKDIHNSSEVKMPKEHFEQLTELDKDFFLDGKLKNSAYTVEKWLEILEQAINENEDIRPNHRYSFGEHKLGTWLVGIASANRKDKKLEVRKQIEDLGFDFSKTGRNTKDVFSRLIVALSKENPNKKDWRTRIYKHVQKQDRFTNEMKKEIEEYWELQFNEKLVWGKMHEAFTDRTDEWKEYKKKTGRWYPIVIVNGENYSLHHWVHRKFKSPKSLIKVLDKFNEKEILELRQIGFKI